MQRKINSEMMPNILITTINNIEKHGLYRQTSLLFVMCPIDL